MSANHFPSVTARPDGLRPGCYVVSYTMIYDPLGGPEPQKFFGSLRVADQDDELRFSGDLYRPGTYAPIDPAGPNPEVFVEMPDAGQGVPTLAFKGYDSYLRGLDLDRAPGGRLAAHFERYGYSTHTDSGLPIWSYGGSFAVSLERGRAGRTVPSPDDYWVGTVRDVAGGLVGVLTLAWVSPFLRKAFLQIALEDGCPAPLDNGQGVGWADVFRRIGWELIVTMANKAIPPASGVWERTDLHAGMLATRLSPDLDSAWLYHLLCVKAFGASLLGDAGFMYDHDALDENHIPREGAAVSSEALFGTGPEFGSAAGLRRAGVPGAYFRGAVHEIGHAMGLYHDYASPVFMAPTEKVAALGTPDSPFPDNIIYDHSMADRNRLRHLPDVLIRPGSPFTAESAGSADNYRGVPPLPSPCQTISH